jgi:Domain of unknown function (DUF4190)
MSDTSQGPGWWLASDGRWYPPELWTGPSALRPAGSSTQPMPSGYPSGTYGHGRYPAQDQSPPHGYRVPSDPPGAQKTNGMAIAALILGCAGLFFIPAVLGIIFGFIARTQIARSNGLQKGTALAIAGIIVAFGWLTLLLVVAIFGHSTNGDNSGIVDPGILPGLRCLGGVAP